MTDSSNSGTVPSEVAEKSDPLNKITLRQILGWLKDYRFIVVAIVGTALGAASGFVGAKAGLSHQIDELRVRIVGTEELRNEFFIRTLYVQMSNLRILEQEIGRIRDFANNWTKPEFRYETLKGSGGFPDQEVAWVKDDRILLSFDSRAFTMATSSDTRAIPDTELTVTLLQILDCITTYNQEFQIYSSRIGMPFGPMPIPEMSGMRTPLRTPITKRDAISFSENTFQQVSHLRGLLDSGITQRLQASRAEIEKIVDRYKGDK